MNMVQYPTKEECEKIADMCGGNPEDCFGPMLYDWIVWDSDTGELSYDRLTPNSWVRTRGGCHVIAQLGSNKVTGKEILEACICFVKYYMENG